MRPISLLHQVNFSILTDSVNKSSTFSTVLAFSSKTFLLPIISLMKWYCTSLCFVFKWYARFFSSNMHSDYHIPTKQLAFQTQSLYIIPTPTLPLFLHQWLQCTQPLLLTRIPKTVSYSSNWLHLQTIWIHIPWSNVDHQYIYLSPSQQNHESQLPQNFHDRRKLYLSYHVSI